jgi:importin-5
MSVLQPEVQAALTQLLSALQSSDNTLRSQAEEQLNGDWTTQRPDVLLMGLAEQSQGAEDASVCFFNIERTQDRVGQAGIMC